MKFRIDSKLIPLLATAAVLVAMYAISALAFHDRGFFTLYTAKLLLEDNAFLGVAAVGMTFVILSGGIDLSVGSVVAFTGILIAKLVAPQMVEKGEVAGLGWHPLTAIAASLLLGAAFGAAQGALIHFYKQPPFLITLAGMFFIRGMGYVVHPQDMGINHKFYTETLADIAIPISSRESLGLTALIFIACTIVGIAIAHFTRFGRAVYAIGDDEASATLMGVPVGRTKVGIYTLSGFLAALSGVVFSIYKGSGWANNALGFELDAIAAVVIGGTLLTGGVGYLAGTAMGVLILGIIQVIVTNMDLSPWWTKIVVGLLLLGFIVLQMLVQSRAARVVGRRRAIAALVGPKPSGGVQSGGSGA